MEIYYLVCRLCSREDGFVNVMVFLILEVNEHDQQNIILISSHRFFSLRLLYDSLSFVLGIRDLCSESQE